MAIIKLKPQIKCHWSDSEHSPQSPLPPLWLGKGHHTPHPQDRKRGRDLDPGHSPQAFPARPGKSHPTLPWPQKRPISQTWTRPPPTAQAPPRHERNHPTPSGLQKQLSSRPWIPPTSTSPPSTAWNGYPLVKKDP